MEESKMLFDFNQPQDAQNWFSVDDGVMGGVSASQIAIQPLETGGMLSFSGMVSLENYGGFASIRTRPERVDLSEYAGLALRVRGDGKTYQLRLRTNANYDGVSYQARFETLAGEWQVIRFPFDSFIPVFRGLRMFLVPALNPAKIFTFGFLIAGKQSGPFRLDVDWIGAYSV